jgi:hypothetical protein
MKRLSLALVAVLVLLGLILPRGAAAVDVVGRVTQVEGRVDLLKGGKLPAIPAKLQDRVEPGDVLRTKSLSRAQITFIDNSVLTISPESRMAIEEYMFDAAQGKRRAVLQLFQGLAHAVIHQVFKVEEPDFVVKTQTALLGVRGTELGFRILPNSSEVLNFKGRSRVSNIFPEVKGTVELKDMQGTMVPWGRPPTPHFDIDLDYYKQFMNQLATGLTGRKDGKGAPPGPGMALAASAATTAAGVAVGAAAAPDLGTLTGTIGGTNTTNIVQNVPTIPPAGTGGTFTFTQPDYIFYYLLSSTSASNYTIGNFSGTGAGTRIGVYPGSFTANYNFNATYDQGGQFPDLYQGEFTASNMSGKVTGRSGGTMTGTLSLTLTDQTAGSFSGTVPITLTSSGQLTANLTGLKGTANPDNAALTVTGGNLVQTPTGEGAAAVRKR